MEFQPGQRVLWPAIGAACTVYKYHAAGVVVKLDNGAFHLVNESALQLPDPVLMESIRLSETPQ